MWLVRWSPGSHWPCAGSASPEAGCTVGKGFAGVQRGVGGRSCPSVCDSPPIQNCTFAVFFSVAVLPGLLLDLLLGFCPTLTQLTKNLSDRKLFFSPVKKAFSSLNCSRPALCRAVHQDGHVPTSAAFSCLERKAVERVQALKIQACTGGFAALCVRVLSDYITPSKCAGWLVFVAMPFTTQIATCSTISLMACRDVCLGGIWLLARPAASDMKQGCSRLCQQVL